MLVTAQGATMLTSRPMPRYARGARRPLFIATTPCRFATPPDARQTAAIAYRHDYDAGLMDYMRFSPPAAAAATPLLRLISARRAMRYDIDAVLLRCYAVDFSPDA